MTRGLLPILTTKIDFDELCDATSLTSQDFGDENRMTLTSSLRTSPGSCQKNRETRSTVAYLQTWAGLCGRKKVATRRRKRGPPQPYGMQIGSKYPDKVQRSFRTNGKRSLRARPASETKPKVLSYATQLCALLSRLGLGTALWRPRCARGGARHGISKSHRYPLGQVPLTAAPINLPLST